VLVIAEDAQWIDEKAVRRLDREHSGLIDALGEHAFHQFRDERIPAPELSTRWLHPSLSNLATEAACYRSRLRRCS
jgi:hypothetical protein